MANAPSLPKTMRAWVVTHRGNLVDVLKLKTDYPVPSTPKGSDLLIRITHACLNPADIFLCNILPTWLPFRRNPILGFDFAGRIEIAGPSAPEEFAPGAEVCASLSLRDILGGRGTLAEFVLVSSDMVSLKPKKLSLAASSGLGITGQTVAIMLKEAKVKEGDRILINGSSGGVGTLLVQVVKAKGAHVTATCSKANISMVKQLGADEVIDYRENAPLYAYLERVQSEQPFDYILDTIRNQELFEHSPKYLKPKGLYVNIGAHGTQQEQLRDRLKNHFLPTFFGGTPRRWMSLGLLPKGELQRQVVRWIDEGLIKEVPIDSEISMDDVLKGYELVESKHAKGKVVVRIQD